MANRDDPANPPSRDNSVHNTPLAALVESYIRYYAAGASHTARAKRLDLKHFLEFLRVYRGYSRLEKLRSSDLDLSAIQRFMEAALQKGEAPTTVARRLATIKHMGRTLADKIPGFVNPAREARPPKIQPLKPQAISTDELHEIRGKAEQRRLQKKTFIRLRNETILEFLLDTGLRADEVRLLKLSQIDTKLEWIKGVRTKGKRYRNVYITSKIRTHLQSYLTEREQELGRFYAKVTKGISQSHPLFISVYGAQPGQPESFYMGAKTLWRAINELSTETQLHPHLLRHSYALELLNSSRDIRLVGQALGHSDVRITMRYTERSNEDVALALEKTRKGGK